MSARLVLLIAPPAAAAGGREKNINASVFGINSGQQLLPEPEAATSMRQDKSENISSPRLHRQEPTTPPTKRGATEAPPQRCRRISQLPENSRQPTTIIYGVKPSRRPISLQNLGHGPTSRLRLFVRCRNVHVNQDVHASLHDHRLEICTERGTPT